MTGPLKLIAEDAENLQVISALLQDALIHLSEMRFLPEERRFVIVANRFRWELVGSRERKPSVGVDACYERVHSGICFEGVSAVRLLGIDRVDRGRILELLTITVEPGRVTLIFAGGGQMCLEVESINCRFRDLDEPWPTPWCPRHTSEEGEDAA